MSKLKSSGPRQRWYLLFALCVLSVLAVPVTSVGQLPGGSVTVCQVTGSASAPNYAQVEVAVDQVAAYLNQFPGSFAGACPSSGGSSGGGTGSGTTPISGAVTICRVSGSASAPILTEVSVAADQVTAFINQNPGSFVGSCSGAGGGAGGSSGAAPANAAVTVCRVGGSANAPNYAQVAVAVDQIAAFLNQNRGAFIGTCPGQGASSQGPATILGLPVGAGLMICQVTGSAGALSYLQTNVAVDRVAAFINQHPSSFVGMCPNSSDPGGTLGPAPLGYVTICRVTGDANSPYAAVTIRADQLAAYVTQAGTIVPPPTAGCPALEPDPNTGEPSTTPTGRSDTVRVETTPNTVVTARGAGVNETTKSDERGVAVITVKPKRPGIITIRGAGGRVIKRVGAVAGRQTAQQLTG